MALKLPLVSPEGEPRCSPHHLCPTATRDCSNRRHDPSNHHDQPNRHGQSNQPNQPNPPNRHDHHQRARTRDHQQLRQEVEPDHWAVPRGDLLGDAVVDEGAEGGEVLRGGEGRGGAGRDGWGGGAGDWVSDAVTAGAVPQRREAHTSMHGTQPPHAAKQAHRGPRRLCQLRNLRLPLRQGSFPPRQLSFPLRQAAAAAAARRARDRRRGAAGDVEGVRDGCRAGFGDGRRRVAAYAAAPGAVRVLGALGWGFGVH